MIFEPKHVYISNAIETFWNSIIIRLQSVHSTLDHFHIHNESIYNIGVLTVNIEFMWRGLETGKSFHPFRAEPHKLYIYRQYTNIVFLLQ
jgi:hypothetical protein